MQLHISDSCPSQKKISLEYTKWNINKHIIAPTNLI